MTSKELKEMANRIKARRKSLKVTQERFAEIIGISASSYTRIENAFQKPSLDTLIKISRNLQLSMDYIIFGEESERDKEMANFLKAQLALVIKEQKMALSKLEALYG